MLTEFPLSEVARVVRHTVIACVVAGVIGCALAALIGHALFGLGLVVGLGLAVANHRMFQLSALRFTTPEGGINRKPFAGSVALRLGVCTAIAVCLMVIRRALGWGVIAGLTLFQALMLANASVALVRYQRQQINGTGGGDA